MEDNSGSRKSKGEEERRDGSEVRKQDRAKPKKRSRSRHNSKNRRSRSSGSSDSRGRRGHGSRSKPDIKFPDFYEPLVTQREFTSLQSHELKQETVEKAYKEYKRKHEEKQVKLFFKEHKRDEWFIEKYEPSICEQMQAEKRLEIQGISKRFFAQLQEGRFRELCLEISDAKYEAILALEANCSFPRDQMTSDEFAHTLYTSEILIPPEFQVLGAPYFGFDLDCLTLFISKVPKDCPREDMLELLLKLDGFVSLSLSEPLKTQNFVRFGWVIFDSEQACDKALVQVQETMTKLNLSISKSKASKRFVKVVPPFTRARLEHHVLLSRQLIEALDKEQGIENNPLLKEASQQATQTYQLDIQVLYLRKVHSYCYFSAAEYHDERILTTKCGLAFLRRSVKDGQDQDRPSALPTWDDKVTSLARLRIEDSPRRTAEEKERASSKELIEREFTRLLRDDVERYLVKDVWFCPYCNKGFEGDTFVMAHIKSRHLKTVIQLKKECIESLMHQLYAADKNKITAPPQAALKETRKTNSAAFPPKPKVQSYKDWDNPRDHPLKDLLNYDSI